MSGQTHPLPAPNLRKYGRKEVSAARLVAYAASVLDVSEDNEMGRTFKYWLGLVCENTAEQHGLKPVRDVASYVDVSEDTIRNFFDGKSRPHEEAGIVAAIAEMCKLSDGRLLYAKALKRWCASKDDGKPIPKRKQPRGPGFDDLPPLGNS